MPSRLIKLQDRLAALLGCDASARPSVVASMLHRNNDATGYWLQLVVSVAIATLGLVLGSTAVVIGAMLIAPLMTPLVNLGMGLAVGSPFLVLRSTVRVVASAIVAIGSSAALTRLLPFNELNAEIAARTTPTALDLLVAAFCAVAGVYAVMRRDSDVASTAAGTSIGISLVPPLCASGFGVGTASWEVASGGALLFLANFVAIIVVSTLSFAATGFHQVDSMSLEANELRKSGDAPVTRRLAKLFSSKGGPWLRLFMPLALLAAVYLPLRKALDEVVWQVGARKQVHSVIERLPYQLVQSRVHVERGRIELNLVLLGSTADAVRARSFVTESVLERTGISPRLEVLAIPDAAAFAGLEAALAREATRSLPAAATPARVTAEEAMRLRASIQGSLERRWPKASAGPLALVSIRTAGKNLALDVVHVGKSLDASAVEALELTLKEDLSGPVRLRTQALPAEPILPPADDDLDSVARLARLLEAARAVDEVSVCVLAPAGAVKSATELVGDAPTIPPKPAVLRLLEREPRVRFVAADVWSIRFVAGPCPEPARVETTPVGASP